MFVNTLINVDKNVVEDFADNVEFNVHLLEILQERYPDIEDQSLLE